MNFQAAGVVLFQVLLHFLGDLGVVSALGVQPEHGRGATLASAVDRQLDPVADRRIFDLAHAEDIARLDALLDQHLAAGIHHLNLAAGRHFKGLVV